MSKGDLCLIEAGEAAAGDRFPRECGIEGLVAQTRVESLACGCSGGLENEERSG